MADFINILKLSVGSESVADHADWQLSQRHRWPEGRAIHVTRMFPKREAEVLNGGSLFWVIKGLVQCRQKILGLEQVTGGDGISRCALILDSEIIRTETAPRRPFQGWRYLEPSDSPADLARGREHEQALPAALAQALAEIGLR
jgi:hypothetical protein